MCPVDIFYVRGHKCLSMDRKFFSMDRNFCPWTKISVRGQTSVNGTDKTQNYDTIITDHVYRNKQQNQKPS
jgi:hypothetical protein